MNAADAVVTGPCRLAGTEPGAEGVSFEFEGRPIRGRRGKSLAAALTAAGERELRKTRAGPRVASFAAWAFARNAWWRSMESRPSAPA